MSHCSVVTISDCASREEADQHGGVQAQPAGHPALCVSFLREELMHWDLKKAEGQGVPHRGVSPQSIQAGLQGRNL